MLHASLYRYVSLYLLVLFEWFGAHRDLLVLTHSVATRRSSDLHVSVLLLISHPSAPCSIYMVKRSCSVDAVCQLRGRFDLLAAERKLPLSKMMVYLPKHKLLRDEKNSGDLP